METWLDIEEVAGMLASDFATIAAEFLLANKIPPGHRGDQGHHNPLLTIEFAGPC
jgi:hypothetical protein